MSWNELDGLRMQSGMSGMSWIALSLSLRREEGDSEGNADNDDDDDDVDDGTGDGDGHGNGHNHNLFITGSAEAAAPSLMGRAQRRLVAWPRSAEAAERGAGKRIGGWVSR